MKAHNAWDGQGYIPKAVLSLSAFPDAKIGVTHYVYDTGLYI